MKSPRTSIIIPVYNGESTILECIKSCLEQTSKNLEIIVIDDGSTDNTSKILSENFYSIEILKIFHTTNRGVTNARNKGIQESTGEYLFFLDADDTIPPDAISNLASKLSENKEDIVAGDVNLLNQNKVYKRRNYSDFGSGKGNEFLLFILKNKLHYLWGKLIRKALFQDYNIKVNPELAIGEDQILVYQLCKFAKNVATSEKVVYEYNFNPASVTQKKLGPYEKSKRWELYAYELFNLKNRIKFDIEIQQQFNLRIIQTLFDALGTSRDHHSKKLLYSTLYKSLTSAIISKHSLLLNHPSLILRSLLYPPVLFLKKRIQIKIT